MLRAVVVRTKDTQALTLGEDIGQEEDLADIARDKQPARELVNEDIVVGSGARPQLEVTKQLCLQQSKSPLRARVEGKDISPVLSGR
jgi:hypothetical protein